MRPSSLHFLPHDSLDKTYLLRITLGVATDTYDATGQILREDRSALSISPESLLQALQGFIGITDQKPPAYSAVKVGGKRAYDLARAGAPPDLAARKVHITSLRLLRDYVAHDQRHLIMRLHCSRGTYVRSIANDLGEKLGCGAHLSYLLRERVGAWSHLQAFPHWKILEKRAFAGTPSFIPLAEILPFSRIVLNPGAETKVEKGIALDPTDIREILARDPLNEGAGMVQVVSNQGALLAIYGPETKPGPKAPGRLVPVRVLTQPD